VISTTYRVSTYKTASRLIAAVAVSVRALVHRYVGCWPLRRVAKGKAVVLKHLERLHAAPTHRSWS